MSPNTEKKSERSDKGDDVSDSLSSKGAAGREKQPKALIEEMRHSDRQSGSEGGPAKGERRRGRG